MSQDFPLCFRPLSALQLMRKLPLRGDPKEPVIIMLLPHGPKVGSSTASAHRQRPQAAPQQEQEHGQRPQPEQSENSSQTPSRQSSDAQSKPRSNRKPQPLLLSQRRHGGGRQSPAASPTLVSPRSRASLSSYSSSPPISPSSPAPSCPLVHSDAAGLSRNFVNALPPVMPERPAMANSNSPSSSGGGGYLEQTASVLSSVGSYMRLPALASTVRCCCCSSSFFSSMPRYCVV
jgi:hypothetical protein